jgi:hypothetical protein
VITKTSGGVRAVTEIGDDTDTMTVRDVKNIDMPTQTSTGLDLSQTVKIMISHDGAHDHHRLHVEVRVRSDARTNAIDVLRSNGVAPSAAADRRENDHRQYATQSEQRMDTQATNQSVRNLLLVVVEPSRLARALLILALRPIMIPEVMSL